MNSSRVRFQQRVVLLVELSHSESRHSMTSFVHTFSIDQSISTWRFTANSMSMRESRVLKYAFYWILFFPTPTPNQSICTSFYCILRLNFYPRGFVYSKCLSHQFVPFTHTPTHSQNFRFALVMPQHHVIVLFLSDCTIHAFTPTPYPHSQE